MAMCVEIEAKLKLARRPGGVGSHKQIIERLWKLGAKFVEEQLHRDCYFDDANATLTRTDKCLRLRFRRVGKIEKAFLTYKGAREKNQFKKRQEIDIEIGDGKAVEKLLSELGYKKALVIKKNRRVWQFGGCEIALDSLPLLGRFVEIEGRNDKAIAAVQKKLGLADLQHIRESYATLAAEKLSQKK
jgi:predicted adenylyl cyclase CyaB